MEQVHWGAASLCGEVLITLKILTSIVHKPMGKSAKTVNCEPVEKHMASDAVVTVCDRSIAEAQQACAAGADALFVKPQLVDDYLVADTPVVTQEADAVYKQPAQSRDLQRLIDELRYVTSGDA
jgi:hypothetical protein